MLVGCQEFRILAIYLVQLGRFQTQCGGIKVEGFYTPYLQKKTVRFYWIITYPTERSLKYFSFLIVGVYGSSVQNDEQIRDTRCGLIKEKGRA